MNITYNQTASALAAATEKARAIAVPVTIVVVDAGGYLVALARLDSVPGVIDFAIRKARTAAAFGVDSDIMGTIVAGAGIHAHGMMDSNGGLLTIAGGIVIRNEAGAITGAIASSGGTPEQDKEIAAAGAAVLAY